MPERQHTHFHPLNTSLLNRNSLHIVLSLWSCCMETNPQGPSFHIKDIFNSSTWEVEAGHLYEFTSIMVCIGNSVPSKATWRDYPTHPSKRKKKTNTKQTPTLTYQIKLKESIAPNSGVFFYVFETGFDSVVQVDLESVEIHLLCLQSIKEVR